MGGIVVGIMTLALAGIAAAAPVDSLDVAAKLKEDQVWKLVKTESGAKPQWVPAAPLSEAELLKVREYVEMLYDTQPSALPGGDSGGRMILRYLASKLPRNDDKSQALEIRVRCVYPPSVEADWLDTDGKTHRWAVSAEESKVFPDAIGKQMDNWADTMFRISAGKLWLKYDVVQAPAPLKVMTRGKGGTYWLTPSAAGRIMKASTNIMIYVFWLPMWNDPPPKGAKNATYSAPYRRFAGHYIVIPTGRGRLKNPQGWVNLDGGLPHEFWHYLTHLARDNGFKGLIARDDAKGKPDWERLKREIEMQGLPVPRYAHEEQYANTFSWRFIKKLKARYNQPIESKSGLPPKGGH